MSFFPDTDQLLLLPEEQRQVYYTGPSVHPYSHNSYIQHSMKQSYVEHRTSDSDLLNWSGNSLGLAISPSVLQPSPTFINTPQSIAASMASQEQSLYHFKQETWPEESPQLSVSTHMPAWTPPQTGLISQGPSSSIFPASSTASSLTSPFISSGTFASHGSPMVKIESPYNRRGSPESQYSAYEDSKVINPHSLLSEQAPATPQMDYAATAMTTLSPRTPDQAQDLFGQSVSSALDMERRPRQRRALTEDKEATCRCHICNTGFKRKSNLASHMETHQANRNKPYSCSHPGCEWKFRRRTDLVRHEKSIHLKRHDHQCAACRRTFGRKDTLDRHRDSGCPNSHLIPHRSKAKRQYSAKSRSRSRQTD